MEIQSRRSRESLHLPEEIIEEILSRLAAKSLLRLRCVSKSWGSLIGSKRFIKTHHQNAMENPSSPQQRFIIQKNVVEWPEQCSLQSVLSEPMDTIPLSPLPHPTNTTVMRFQIVGCCDGLLCIIDQLMRIHLWNPSTRISKKLPAISYVGYARNCGFGSVESSGDYKVFVHVIHYDFDLKDIKWVGQVYSSKTKSWKTIEHCADLLFCGREGVFAGGKLYWTSFNGHKEEIIFFDLKSEVFGRIELPFDQEKYWFCSVGSIGGFLCVLSCNYKRGVRVWVMESWEKVVTLDRLLELLQPPPLLVGVKGEILVNCGSTVLVYECQDNVFRSLKYCSCCWNSVFTNLDDCASSISERVYVESLVSPEDL